MKKITILLMICVISLTGCTTNTTSNIQVKGSQELKHHLYGKLEANNDSYIFTEFSEHYNNNEPWVRLTDFQPMWNIGKESCLTGIVELTNRSATCQSESLKLFREKGTDFTVKRTSGYILLSVFSLGLWATMPPGSVEFNHGKYLKAVEQANRKLHETSNGNNSEHEALLLKYDEAMSNFERSYKIISSEYQKKSAQPLISMNDQSGLFKGTSDTFQKFISVKRNNIIELETNLQSSSLENLVFITENRNQKAINELIKKSENFFVNCKGNSLKGVKYTLKCPQTVLSSESKFTVEAVIHSIDYKRVIPNNFNESDQNLTINMRSGIINIVNKTDNFVSIDSLSFYHNGNIASEYKMNYELPPGSEKDILSINSMPIVWKFLSFYDVTRNSANIKKIEYGFAVKYTISDTNKEKTFFKRNTYRLIDLIAAR